MIAPHRSTICALLLGTVVVPSLAQDTGAARNTPFVFFTPGIAVMDRDTNHDRFFNSIDTTLVVPNGPHTSLTGTFSLQFKDKPRWSAAGNYDWFLNEATTLRGSAGLFDDELGLRATLFQQRRRFGTGVRLGAVGNDLEVGGFVTLPFAWGFPLRRESMGERLHRRGRVTDMGASAAVGISLRGGQADLGTQPEYFWPRDSEWPRLGQNPQGHSATPAGLASRLHQIWVTQTGAAVRSSAAIVADTVYVGSDDGYVYALEFETGELRWRYRIGTPVRSSPTVANGRVFVGTEDGALFCFQEEADKRLSADRVGHQLWRHVTGGAIGGSPLVTVTGRVVFGSQDGTLYALDAESARPIWTYPTGGPISASPVRSEGLVPVVGADGTPAAERDVLFCASEDGCLYALTERDGKLLWKVNSGAPIRLTPIVAGRRLVAVNSDGRVLALDARSGQEVWGQDLGALAGGGPALVGRRVVVPLRQGRLVGLSADTGELEWAAGLPAQIEATPIAVEGGTVYVGSTEGHLYAVDSAEGGVKWDFATGGPISASPSVAHGRLVCGSHDGAIYAFGGSPPADGVATHSVGSGDRVVSAKPAPIDALPKPPPVPVLQATSARPPAPTGALSRPPATLPPSTPAVISVPQPAPTASTGSDLQLTLVSEPADASELPIQLTNSRETRVAWGSTAPSADVDGVPVLNRDGQIEVLKAFGEDGTYPVTMTTGTGTRDERISCRLVIVDTGPEPTARRDVAFSPDGDGVGDTIALRAAASSAGSSVASRTVGIRDAQGRVLRTWSAPSDGETTFVWDGKDGAGNRVASGIYEVIYAAKDAQGRTVQMKQRILLQRAGERLAAN